MSRVMPMHISQNAQACSKRSITVVHRFCETVRKCKSGQRANDQRKIVLDWRQCESPKFGGKHARRYFHRSILLSTQEQEEFLYGMGTALYRAAVQCSTTNAILQVPKARLQHCTYIMVWNSVTIVRRRAPLRRTNKVGPCFPPVSCGLVGKWQTFRLTQSAKIGTQLKKRVHSILFGPGFNSACKPPFPLPAPMGVDLFAPDVFGVAFDRLHSEVVRCGIVDLT
jgi:hypothetical protein